MSQHHAISAAGTFSPAQMKCFEGSGQRIILANVTGEFYARDVMQSHENFPLRVGALKDHSCECSWQ